MRRGKVFKRASDEFLFLDAVGFGIRLSRPQVRALAAELRALLAVARAANTHSHAEVQYDPVDESRHCSICRALARLDRVSREGR